MRRRFGMFVAFSVVLVATAASAQEQAAGASRWEVTGFPGGGIVFTAGSEGAAGKEPNFGDYALGASLTFNFNQYWGVEGEVGGAFGIDQRLNFGRGRSVGDVSPPNMLAYHGNIVFYPLRNDRRFVPYATGGAGGLTMFDKQEVGFTGDETFLTGNVGGGLKWYLSDRWGVRGDYRFFAIDSKDNAPAFFGRDTRYGHRVYAGLIFSVAR